MNVRKKRRGRRTVTGPSEAAELRRISTQLARIQSPVDPDLLGRIDARLDRIETGMERVHADATRRGAVAGGFAGGITSLIIFTAIELIRARLGT